MKMIDNCYYHNEEKAVRKCDNCGKNLCKECIHSYWYTNTISVMFQAQKRQEKELFLCHECLKKIKTRNTLVSSFLLILVLGVIISSIMIAIY